MPKILKSSFLAIGLLISVCCLKVVAAPAWGEYAKKSDEWYRSEEGRHIAANILSWQSPHGSWPKNGSTAAKPSAGDAQKISGTFDNGATVGELRFLARAFRATGNSKCQAAFLKGIDAILKAQYPSGGWPQFYPPSAQYHHRRISFNDGTMVRLMELLREVAKASEYSFVDAARRNGYAWYGNWGESVAARYATWRAQQPE